MMQIPLNGLWRAKLDPENVGLAEGWAQNGILAEHAVRVPGCIQQLDTLADSYPPENGLRNSFQGTWFAERELQLPPFAGQRIYLMMEGAAPACHLYVNGQYVARHIFTLCPWQTDITAFAKEGENRITIAVTEDYSLMYAGSRFCGLNWSGIYGDVYVLIGGAVRLTEVYLSPAGVEGKATNHADASFEGALTAQVFGQQASAVITLAPGQSEDFLLPIDTAVLPRWYVDDPQCVTVFLLCNGDETILKTGFRTLETKGGRILMNGLPLFLAGAGEEYESMDISPLTDEALIRRRFQALKDHGFNFYRYHTHVPTEKELRIADEMGFLVDAEVGLVSNFHKTLPVEHGFDMLERYVRHTRNHPSLLIYCLGNEGSQLMVESQTERNKARMGYDLIKRSTQNQFALTCFGNQGELPELKNDIETPHLWSDNFLAAYDGLSRVPWELLAGTTLGRPCVVHEYGKFGVWPDMRDEQANNARGGILRDFATQARQALAEQELMDMEAAFIKNSRLHSGDITRIILEEARRQPFISGYTLWSFFRGGPRNTGLCDDTGTRYDGDPAVFRNGCNAPVALLMDRGFQGRALACYAPQKIGITLSNFGRDAVQGGLCAALYCEGKLIAKTCTDACAMPGETKEALQFAFIVPGEFSGKKLLLEATLGEVKNAWDFWAFDCTPGNEQPLLHLQDPETEAQIMALCPQAIRLQDADSIRIGCRSWTHPRLCETVLALQRMVIADTVDAVVKDILASGGQVLLLDTGRLPEDWYNPAVLPTLGERDTGRYFSSFRAGWHTGNLLTVIENDALLGHYPQDGLCGLHFYAMLQSARGLHAEKAAQDTGCTLNSVIYGVAKVPCKAAAQIVVQDPNAIKEQRSTKARTFDMMRQDYLLAGEHLTVCSMKLLRDPAGKALLRQMLC